MGEGAKKSAFPDKRPKLQSERRLPAWPWRDITHKFFKTLFNWLQGLSEIRLGFTPLLEDGFYLEPANQAMLKYPLAIVNVKKIFSGASVGNLTLREYAGRDAAFIRWQVRGILSPNIVVCGSGSGSLLNIAEESIYPDLTFSPINSWCHYCDPPELLLIDSWHPSSRIPDSQKIDGMMRVVAGFIAQTHADIFR